MAGRIEETRKRYDMFTQGDVQGATENWADDMVWQGGNGPMPGGGEHKGKQEALRAMAEGVGSWDEFKLTPEEFFENGDTVVMVGHTEVSKGGQSATGPVVHILRWEGDQLKRLEIVGDSYQALQLLGAS